MKIGLQLFSIKNISEERGLCETLKKAGQLGYDSVEFAGYFGLAVDEILRELDKNNLEVAGIHQGVDSLRNDFDETLKTAKALGAYSFCVPWFSADTIDEYKKFGKELEEYGKRFNDEGIVFGYHNHAHEFKAIDGTMPIDAILENCSGENVFFEMDTRHIVVAGQDPVEYAKKYSGRIPVLHARDNNGTADCAVGDGKVDFPNVLKNAGKINVFVVENENFGKNEDELADSVKYLKTII